MYGPSDSWYDPPEVKETHHQNCTKCGRMEECEEEYGMCEDCCDRWESWADDCKVDDAKEDR